MASIEVIVRDDEGNIISQGNTQEINLKHANLDTVEAAVEDWRKRVLPKEKWQELLTYLNKHQHEIIDYERRQKAGKPIGSGRVEKAVDQVIGHRQKHKGPSWRP
jgi:DNA-binding response OmpR family regulator